ncbi:NAD(P)H-dependent oxidoreductase [Sphaerisporangium fuscum]|uniref:NAD(P)H-dependent oxidoreductase n=1 Tax=Sphaerisporangium fuscum TaxID=2835868 RepID=UPI001BDCC49C|nr:NAD(P)H-dependent oxidoreductase [Sphaerisporangium fuscum]
MKVIGIAGSLPPRSYVRRLLEASGRGLPAQVEFEIWDGPAGVPPVGDGPPPPPVTRLCDALASADGMLIAAPAHSVLPPELCHLLEWLASSHGGTALLGKPVVVVTACPRPYEAMWTQTLLRKMLEEAGATVYGVDLAVSSATDGASVDPASRARLADALGRLVPAGGALAPVREDAQSPHGTAVRDDTRTRGPVRDGRRLPGHAPVREHAPVRAASSLAGPG